MDLRTTPSLWGGVTVTQRVHVLLSYFIRNAGSHKSGFHTVRLKFNVNANVAFDFRAIWGGHRLLPNATRGGQSQHRAPQSLRLGGNRVTHVTRFFSPNPGTRPSPSSWDVSTDRAPSAAMLRKFFLGLNICWRRLCRVCWPCCILLPRPRGPRALATARPSPASSSARRDSAPPRPGSVHRGSEPSRVLPSAASAGEGLEAVSGQWHRRPSSAARETSLPSRGWDPGRCRGMSSVPYTMALCYSLPQFPPVPVE